jgi:hypothetical protein
LQGPPKLTQIGIFGLKIYHLATLVATLLSILIISIFSVAWGQSYDFLIYNYNVSIVIG